MARSQINADSPEESKMLTDSVDVKEYKYWWTSNSVEFVSLGFADVSKTQHALEA